MKTAPLFSGKRIDTEEFIKGNLIVYPTVTRIQVVLSDNASTTHEVNPATVEQIAGDVVESRDYWKKKYEKLLERSGVPVCTVSVDDAHKTNRNAP